LWAAKKIVSAENVQKMQGVQKYAELFVAKILQQAQNLRTSSETEARLLNTDGNEQPRLMNAQIVRLWLCPSWLQNVQKTLDDAHAAAGGSAKRGKMGL
jgi:hypothetical protein